MDRTNFSAELSLVLVVAVVLLTAAQPPFSGAVRPFDWPVSQVVFSSAPRSSLPGDPRATFTIVESVPEEVVRQGAGRTAGWLQGPYNQPAKFSMSDVTKCSAGIAVAVGSNLVAFSKFLKIRAAIRALGGTARVISQATERTKRGEQLMTAVTEVFNDAGAGLGAVAAEFLSIDQIVENCFSLGYGGDR